MCVSPKFVTSFDFEKITLFLEDSDNKTYELLKTPVVSETFFGTNNIRYKHIYYIAKLLDDNIVVKIDSENENQVTEISNIGWFNYNESLNIIRPYNTQKKEVVHKINNIINKYI